MDKRKKAIAKIRKNRIINVGKQQKLALIKKVWGAEKDYSFINICKTVKKDYYCKSFLTLYERFELAKYISEQFGTITNFSKFKHYQQAAFYYFK